MKSFAGFSVALCASLLLAATLSLQACHDKAKNAPVPGPVTARDAGKPALAPAGSAYAVFAGGCFWCVESDFDHLIGVTDTQSGYTGGALKDPSYEDVVTETTGHYESVRVTYDPTKISYETLLDYFWHHVDPTDAGGQFCDRGPSYRTAIFVADDAQRAAAQSTKEAIDKANILPAPIVTEILPLMTFYPAEGYHQDYYKKNSLRYNFYRANCGRDRRVGQVWSAAPKVEFPVKEE